MNVEYTMCYLLKFFRGFHIPIPIPIPGISEVSRFITRDFSEIFKSRSWSARFWYFRYFAFGIFSGFFRDFHIPIPIPGISEVSGFITRDFPRFSNPDPDLRDFSIFGILHSGFFQDFQIPIPIPGILGIFGILHSGFFRNFSRFSYPDPDLRDFRNFSI